MNTTILGALVAVNLMVLVATRMRKGAAANGKGAISVDDTQRALAANAQKREHDKFAIFGRMMKGRKEAGVIERNLVTAGLLLKPTEFFAINIIFFATSAAVGLWYISTKMALDWSFAPLLKRTFATVAFLYIGWKGPQMVLGFLAGRRRGTLENQLVDALTIISSGLRGGYSFVQGLDMASQQLNSPLKEEFQRVMRLIQLGMDTPRALLQMAERINSYDYDMTVSATNIQLAAGGNLSHLLDGIAATIQDRIRMRRDVAALTAQGRISGGILLALPLGIAFFLRVINPEYMGRLTDTELGQNIIYGAMVQWGIGLYWIKKLLDFDG